MIHRYKKVTARHDSWKSQSRVRRCLNAQCATFSESVTIDISDELKNSVLELNRTWAQPLSCSQTPNTSPYRQILGNFTPLTNLTVPTGLHNSAQSLKTHWCGRTWLARTESWPQPKRTCLGWIRVESASQVGSVSVPDLWEERSKFPHHIKHYELRMGHHSISCVWGQTS